MASVTTRDHEEIQRWAEQHGATPAVVSRTGGMLRFEFSPDSAGSLAPVDWDEFFQVFDEKGLDLIYDEKPGSRFHKFAYPETVAAKTEHRAPRRPARAGKRVNIAGPAAAGESGNAASGVTAGTRARGRRAPTSAAPTRSRTTARGTAKTASARSSKPSPPTAKAKTKAKPGPTAVAGRAGTTRGSGRGASRTRRTPPGEAA